MAAVVTIRNWLVTLVESLTPETQPGKTFKHSVGTEPLDGMPKDEAFHRAFRVLWDNNPTIADAWLPLEPIDVVTIQIGYLGQQNDRRLIDMIDQDAELVMRYILQPEPTGMPSSVYNINVLAHGQPRDVGGGGANALVKDLRYEIHYVCAAV